MTKNPFKGKKKQLDAMLTLLAAMGLNAHQLDAWATARGMLIDAQESARDFEKDGALDESGHSLLDEWDSQLDSTLDGGSRDFVRFIYEDVAQAMKVAYTRKELNRNLIKRK